MTNPAGCKGLPTQFLALEHLEAVGGGHLALRKVRRSSVSSSSWTPTGCKGLLPTTLAMDDDNAILPITANPMHGIVSVAEETYTPGSASIPPPTSGDSPAPAPAHAPGSDEAPDSAPTAGAPSPPIPEDEATEPTPLDIVCVNDAGAVAIGRQTNSFGVAVLVMQFSAHLRLRVHKGHQLIAKRVGVALMACTGADVIALTSIRIMHVIHSDAVESGGEELYIAMTHAFSVAAFILHAGLGLGYDGMRTGIAAHFGLMVFKAVIEGVFAAVQGEIGWAAYYLIGWCAVLYPLGGWGLHQFLCVAQKLDTGTREAFLRSTLVAFMVSTMPILYFFSNGMICIAFEGGSHCAVRTKVNRSAIHALVGNAVMFLMMALRPVTLKQVAHLDIPPTQFVAFGFHGVILFLALALHSQNENFGPVPRVIELLDQMNAPCFLLFLVSFVVATVTHIRDNEEDGTDHALATAVVPARNSIHGQMVPHRVVMSSFTGLFLAVTVCPGGRMVSIPFGPLSYAAACSHFWVTAEEGESVSRSAQLHLLAHASSSVASVARFLSDGDHGQALGALIYVVAYPWSFKILARFRTSVWSHGRDSAAKLVAVSFVAFWSGTVPAMLYFGADSLGTACPLSFMH